MRTALFTLVILATLLAACKSNSKSAHLETVEETDEYGYLEVYQRRKSDFAREGWYQLINQDGVVIEAAQYEHDTLQGQRILFYDTGDTNIVETYHLGLFDGPYRVYREDGSLSVSGQFTNNVREGEWYGYYDNGAVKEIVMFQDNLENGAFTEYHPNGKLKAEGYYRDGDNEDGQLKIYNENGELVKRMDCDMGRCNTVWSADETDSNH
ncbi:MAG: toxin-antitoxin system YwqK family antitoxin [Lewinella sp.]|nr:toxin-antitoxin system YwqK family antitoxin [Lewinella sp.]